MIGVLCVLRVSLKLLSPNLSTPMIVFKFMTNELRLIQVPCKPLEIACKLGVSPLNKLVSQRNNLTIKANTMINNAPMIKIKNNVPIKSYYY